MENSGFYEMDKQATEDYCNINSRDDQGLYKYAETYM